MDYFSIRPLAESDLDAVIAAAGGTRAHPDADRRTQRGADYLLAEAIIELKQLDDEGLAKPERQTKVAALYAGCFPERPVIVLDPQLLPEEQQGNYYRIMEGPVKGAVKSASKQLKQSRAEHPAASTTILFVVNNGYTALDHTELVRMVAHRARQDTAEIDGVVVAGCYFYSDSFDSFFLWPIDYIPIRIDRPFAAYERLREAWNNFANRFMAAAVSGRQSGPVVKGPVVDTQFDVNGVTFVKPTPPMGKPSEFFVHGRPRTNSSGLKHCPTVAITFPDLLRDQWQRFREALPSDVELGSSYDAWRDERRRAVGSGSPLKPFVPMPVDFDSWKAWCDESGAPLSVSSIRRYANMLFERKIRTVMTTARERSPQGIVPTRYVLAMIECIGQDEANDVSHIAVVCEQAHATPVIREVVVNARLFQSYALAVASAHAVAEGADFVLFEKDLRYAWS